jgi:hypothetical protein
LIHIKRLRKKFLEVSLDNCFLISHIQYLPHKNQNSKSILEQCGQGNEETIKFAVGLILLEIQAWVNGYLPQTIKTDYCLYDIRMHKIAQCLVTFAATSTEIQVSRNNSMLFQMSEKFTMTSVQNLRQFKPPILTICEYI